MKTKILLADDNQELRDLLLEFIKGQGIVDEIEGYSNGLEVIRYFEQENHDVDLLILDNIMPHLDGMGVIEKLKEMNIKSMPKIMLITAFGQENVIQSASHMGVNYFLVKPFDFDLLAKRITEILNEDSPYYKQSTLSQNYNNMISLSQKPVDLNKAVTEMIMKIGIQPHLKGYNYIREAIILVYQDQSNLNAITKVVYPSIADKFNTSPPRVERAIRHAIEVMWVKGQIEHLSDIFGYRVQYDKPTNGQFIAMVADKMRISS